VHDYTLSERLKTARDPRGYHLSMSTHKMMSITINPYLLQAQKIVSIPITPIPAL